MVSDLHCYDHGLYTHSARLEALSFWWRDWHWYIFLRPLHDNTYEGGFEWYDDVPVFVANADVASAFGNATPEACKDALETWGVHGQFIAALVAEAVGLECTAVFEGLVAKFPYTK